MALQLRSSQCSPPDLHAISLLPGTELNHEIVMAQDPGTAHGPLSVGQEQHFTGHSEQGQTLVVKGTRTRF